MKLEELKDKKILILGFGREGKDTFKFLRKIFPKKVLGIGDRDKNSKFKIPRRSRFATLRGRQNSKLIKWHLGEKYLKAIKNYEVVIKSPGIQPKAIKSFVTKKQKITSQTEIFFENCPGIIVGVAGTKGKGTTASLIYQILKERLKAHPVKFASRLFNKVNLVGNIGKPVLNLLFSAGSKDIYIYEISSHQLIGLKKPPSIAVFLNIYPDHLDYYKNLKEYVAAEANIAKYQTKKDYLIYNSQDKIVKKIAKKSKARKIPVKGVYYELNKEAARAVGKLFKIPKKTIEKTIKAFKPLLPHRLEYVGKFRGIEFYDDSASTIPESAVLAINALGNKIETIFLGGSDKGLDFKNLAKTLISSKIKNIVFFSGNGKKIWQEIKKERQKVKSKKCSELPKCFFVDNMKEAVRLSYEYTGKGKICLLSPASASFGLFKDYKERGVLFKKYVKRFA